MKTNCYKHILLILLFPFCVTFSQTSRTITFKPDDFTFGKSKGADSVAYDRVNLTNGYHLRDVGNPELPVKRIRLIIPSDQDLNSIVVSSVAQEKAGIYNINPAQPAYPTSIDSKKPAFVKPNTVTYQSNVCYPKNPATIIHQGYFDGDKHIVTVEVCPVSYYPASGKIVLNTSMNLTFQYKAAQMKVIHNNVRSSGAQLMYNQMLNNLVDNPEMISTYAQKSNVNVQALSKSNNNTMLLNLTSSGLPAYEYVIITTSALQPYFNNFITWKARKGINIGVVTVDQIYAKYTGDYISSHPILDNPGKIRQYLSDAYQQGTVFALLAGRYTDVPVRYGCPWYYNTWTWATALPNDFMVPADIYFADFNGDWNLDGNIYYGQTNSNDGFTQPSPLPSTSYDNPDYHPEIFVGRIACENGQEILNWTDKVIKYELNPGNGNSAYVANVFWLVGTPDNKGNWPTYENPQDQWSNLPSTMNNTLNNTWGQSNTPYHAPDVVNKMSTGFGLMNVQCHGSHTVFQVGYDGSIPGDGAVWTSDVYSNVWGTHAEANGALNDLTNISYPSLFYSISCQNASIDSFQTAQWPGRSVAEGYTVMSPSIGGPAFFGNTRYGLVGPSSSLLDEFDLLLKAGTVVDGQLPFHAGVAEMVSKQLYIDNFLEYSHNLIGCPEMPIWTATPSIFSSATVTDNGSSVTVNAGMSGCTITACSCNNGSQYFLPTSNVSNYTFSTSVRPLYITITKQNYLPYTAITGGTITSNEQWFDNMKILGNLTINSGVAITAYGNVTVNSGVTLTVSHSAIISFASNASLIVNGVLNATGTSASPITFTSTSGTTASSWGSIILNGSGASGSNLNYITMQYGTDIQFLNGASGTLQNSTIKNCTRGVYVYNSNANISSNLFQDNLNEAIYCNGSGYTHQININTITKTRGNPQYHQQWAIDVSGTSYGYISKNDISGFIYGMWIGGGATAYFLKENQNQPYTYPNNRIRDCYYAVTAAWGGSVRNDTYYYMWYSSIYNNVFYDLYAYQSGTIYSICDYYGGGNPKTSKDGTSTITVQSPLSSDPWVTGLSKTTASSLIQTNDIQEVDSNNVDESVMFEQKKDYAGAIEYYRSLLKNGKISQKTLAALAHFGAEAGNKDVTYYYETLKTTKNEYQSFVMELLAGLYTHQGDNQKSVAIYDEIIKAFPNTYHEKLAWFQKFYYALHVENNKSKALDLLNTIKSKYSNDDAEGNIERAESILSSAGGLEKKGAEERLDGQLGQSEKQLESLTTFQLLQNYPNPFNPTTMISYQLPNDAKVTLKVFDILGREVATLVEGEVGAGIHTATFDGSRYSSGMYFVRLVVRAQGGGTFTKTIKMLMLK